VPLIDLRCTACGHVFEYMRPLADWPSTPSCESCQSSTEQMLLPTGRSTVDPIVVFRAPDGTFRFPGDANGAGAARYARDGFTRIELRGAAEVRRFEKAVNQHEFSRAMRVAENRQRAREAREATNRSELRQRMQSMSRFGRDVARTAMSRNDQKPRESAKEPGFHSDAYSNDRSSREPSYDPRGRRRRD